MQPLRKRTAAWAAVWAWLAAGHAQAGNLLSNPTFDSDLAGWTASAGFTHDAVSGYPTAGSARALTLPGTSDELSQCVNLPTTALEGIRALARCSEPNGQSAATFCRLRLHFFAAENCQGPVWYQVFSSPVTPPADWELTGFGVDALVARPSVLYVLENSAVGAATGANGHFDAALLNAHVRGDFDDDEQTDLLLRDGLGRVVLWRLAGTSLLGERELFTLPLKGQVVATGEFNGDDFADIVVRNVQTGELRAALGGNGHPGQSLAIVPTPARGWTVAAAGDFQANGTSDLVLVHPATSQIEIWLMGLNQRIGVLTPTPNLGPSGWRLVGAADFDGDGYPDFLWHNPVTGKLVLWYLDANAVRLQGVFTNPDSAGDTNWQPLAVGDYGAGPGGLAGTHDIVWQNSVSGRVVVWHMDRSGNRTAGVFTQPDTPAGGLRVIGPR